jgi:parvulin-like peptidyl-prolyl isomerase
VIRTVAVIFTLGAFALPSCRRDEGQGEVSPTDPRTVEHVVARVGGQAIGAAETEARMRADGLDAEAALQQLIDEELLFSEARRAGFIVDREAERTVERQMVRAMLRDLEAENAPASVTAKELREDFELHKEKLQVPERRRSWHILASDTGDAGRARAQSILRELREAEDPRAIFDRYAEAAPSLGVKAEDLPPISRNAGIEKPYKDALFGAKSEGVINEVVKTSYGWHVIVVVEIQPAERRTATDVEEETRERLSQKNRFERLTQVLRDLETEGLVERDEETIGRLVSADSRLEPAE